MNRCISMIVTFGVLSAAAAGVPPQINHQGVVRVDGVPFNGTGLFKFAIVDPDAPSNLWSNDGSITGAVGGVPIAAVSLTVTNGVYSVALGDTSIANMTNPIAPSVFNDDNAVLRIWFDDAVNGEQQLSPDHKLTTAPYTMVAATSPPIGSIIAWHKSLAGVPSLSDGWAECNGQTLNDPASDLNGVTLPNLNGEGRFLRGTAGASGANQNATQVAVTVQTDTGALFFNSSGLNMASFNSDFDEVTSTTVGARGKINTPSIIIENFDEVSSGRVRAKNMSVVWIMRVK